MFTCINAYIYTHIDTHPFKQALIPFENSSLPCKRNAGAALAEDGRGPARGRRGLRPTTGGPDVWRPGTVIMRRLGMWLLLYIGV